MEQAQQPRGFILLQAGAFEADPVALRAGDAELFEAHDLAKVKAAALGPRFAVGDYLKLLPHVGEFRRCALPAQLPAQPRPALPCARAHVEPAARALERRGPGMELAPLAEVHPLATPPDFAPLSQAALRDAFALQPGPAALAAEDLGVPVDSSALGSRGQGGAAVAPAAAAAPAAAPVASREAGPTASGMTTATAATAATAGGAPKIKIKLQIPKAQHKGKR
jgi:hypothetical protein